MQRSTNGTRLISSVLIQATSVQYSSDYRIKLNISSVDTDDLLKRVEALGIREYGYTDDWKKVRGIEDKNLRVRIVISQGLGTIFHGHIMKINNLS